MSKEAVDDLTPAQRVVEPGLLNDPDVIRLIDPEQYLAADEVERARLRLDAVDRYQAGLTKSNP
jgi:hypothetical protein